MKGHHTPRHRGEVNPSAGDGRLYPEGSGAPELTPTEPQPVHPGQAPAVHKGVPVNPPPPGPRPDPDAPEIPPASGHVLQRPVLFGEVLFDCFAADGSEVLGGAPFNVAWHLQGLGLHPIFVSRVGEDDRGAKVVQAMREWGLSVEGVQRDGTRPTGEVDIRLEDGQPIFDIKAEQAYDYIDAGAACRSVTGQPLGLLYHGTLALRTSASAEALAALRRESGLRVFLDLNLREPWWTEEGVDRAVDGADWLKLNEDELGLVLKADVSGAGSREAACAGLVRERGLDWLLVTRGSDGVEGFGAGGSVVREKPAPVENMVDPVGAGDAFSSVVIFGLLRRWPREVVIRRAVRFASEICGIRGATTFDRDLYRRCISEWGDDRAGD